jgi:Pyrimidine dimer DNA glycosylase
MQTFLPYPSFIDSARCLDRQRLGKQRVEGYQILRTLLGISDGWTNHPATKMWRGHEYMLRLYTQTCIDEWLRRGYKNNIVLPMPADAGTVPSWLGNKQFHSSHRSNLLRKDPTFYSQFGWSDNPDAPYWWPI